MTRYASTSKATQTGSTLLDILCRPDPRIIDQWKGTSLSNTVSETDSFDHVQIQSVTRWTDFTYEAIVLAYGDILNRHIRDFANDVGELRYYQEPNDPPMTPSIIIKEDDVDTLGISWSCEVVRGPIKAAAGVLRPRLKSTDASEGKSLSKSLAAKPNATLAAKKVSWVKPKTGSKRVTINPDWLVMDHTVLHLYSTEDAGERVEDKWKPLVYALGDSKLEQKWQSHWLAMSARDLAQKGYGRYESERLKPLDQIATYCRYGETRYAYIVTQKELVALRVRRVLERSGKPGGPVYSAVEYASVPWGSTEGLTVNLAIWALGCMGMNDKHRRMQNSKGYAPDMPRLTYWEYDAKYKDYKNEISGRRIRQEDWNRKWEANGTVTTDSRRGWLLSSPPGSSKGSSAGAGPGAGAGCSAGTGSGSNDHLVTQMSNLDIGGRARTPSGSPPRR
ncbi:hypothetical protein QBC44DRAFT_384672 [Cladorrhinum sp. PSN332]|nr:hypothetical protein QBC44DRAFT_384672 [Cladorrhinum sp. PSN332]